MFIFLMFFQQQKLLFFVRAKNWKTLPGAFREFQTYDYIFVFNVPKTSKKELINMD